MAEDDETALTDADDEFRPFSSGHRFEH